MSRLISMMAILPLPVAGRRVGSLVERNLLVYRRGWLILLSGFFEPLFYLVGIGFGLGGLLGSVDLGDGRVVGYAAFIAPALLATSAMNGAVYESTFNVFFKLRHAKTYDAVVATPVAPRDLALGEIGWALFRGGLYGVGFVIVMVVLGLVTSPWAVLSIPAALLVGFAAAAVGMGATLFMTRWQHFDLVFVVTLPLFLFSGTFFPLTAYPEPIRWLVEITPLYRGVHLIRGLTTGTIEPMLLVDVAYLLILGGLGVILTVRRLERLLRR